MNIVPLSYLLFGFDLIKRTVEDAGPYGFGKYFFVSDFCLSASAKYYVFSKSAGLKKGSLREGAVERTFE